MQSSVLAIVGTEPQKSERAKERRKEKIFDACTQCVLAIFPILMNPSCFRRFQINIIKCIICINCPYRYIPY